MILNENNDNISNPESEDVVFVIKPLAHGNGGCCGEKVLMIDKLDKVLKISPSSFGYRFNECGYDYELCICKTKNMNDYIYIADHEYDIWEKKSNR